MDEAELAFVATMRDEASSVARDARRQIDRTTGQAAPITVPLRINNMITAALRSASAQLAGISRQAQATGRDLTTKLTLPLVGAGLAVGAVSVDFSRSMGDVASLLPGNTQRVNELRDAVLEIGPAAGSSLSDTAAGLYQTLSAFGDTADTAKILETNAKAARAGAASVSDAIGLTSAVTKAYGDTSAKAVRQAADLGLLTVRLGQTTFPELAGSVGGVTPLMKSLGGSTQELFAIMATFTGVTGGASEVSTQLSGALQSLMAPSADAAKAIKKAGYESGAALVEQEGLAGAIGFLTDQAEKTGKPLQNYIGSIEGQIVALGLAGAQGESYAKNLKEMSKAAGATKDAFESSTTGVGEQAFAWDQAKVEASKLLIEIGDGLAPALFDLIDAAEPVVDVISDAAQAFSDADPQIQTAVAALLAVTAAVGPMLFILGTIGRGVAGVIAGMSAMSGAFGRGRAAVSAYAGSLRTASTRQAALARGARIGAGMAGMGLLIASTQTADKMTSRLTETLGLAAVGFSVGGPWGAAIGGAVGILKNVVLVQDDVIASTGAYEDANLQLADSLNQVTGAATKQARGAVAQNLAEQNLLNNAQRLGVANRDVISAVLGNEQAYDRVTAAILKYRNVGGAAATNAQIAQSDAAVNLAAYLGVATKEFEQQGREVRAAATGVTTWKQALKGLPKKVQTQVREIGTTDSIKRIRKLQQEYKLNPKKLETVVRALNVDASEKEIKRIRDAVLETSRTKGGVPEFAKGVDRDTTRAKRTADISGKEIKRSLENPLLSTRASLDAFTTSITTGSQPAITAGTTGGRAVGRGLQSGIIAGFAGTQAILSAQAAAAVRAAVTAAKNAGKIHSPSRLTDYVGRMLGEGLIGGLIRSTKNGGREARRIVNEILAGLDPTAGEASISAAFDSIGQRIEKLYRDQYRSAARRKLEALADREAKELKGADSKKERDKIRDRFEKERDKLERERDSADDRAAKKARELGKAYAQQRNELIANGRQLDRLRGNLADATAQGVAFADSLKAYGALGQTETVNDAPVTAGFIAQDLEQRLAEITAYRRNLQTLRDRGLDEKYVDQLEAAGVQAGGATAAALAVATNEQLANIERLQGQIGQQSNAAGVESVRGVVAGIQSEIRSVEIAGRAIARALRKAIRDELKIKSPSRLTRADGGNTARGLALGILDGVPAAQRAALQLSRAVADAATPTIPRIPLTYAPSAAQLAGMADAAATRTLTVRSTEVVTIRHEITSPDGSVDQLTADQIATMIARDPKVARRIEAALKPVRRRADGRTLAASDNA